MKDFKPDEILALFCSDSELKRAGKDKLNQFGLYLTLKGFNLLPRRFEEKIAQDFLEKLPPEAERKYQEALKGYEKAVSLNPEHAEAWYEKGNVLARLGKIKEAEKSYEKALFLSEKRGNSALKKKIQKALKELKTR